jgi:hypothetical protein
MPLTKDEKQTQIAHLKKRIMDIEDQLQNFIVDLDALLIMEDIELTADYEVIGDGENGLES